jgi:23S rRNA (cytosine1962-C5)-methyltransferase
MSETQHDAWMGKSLNVISEVLNVSADNIFLKLRQRKAGRLGQYQKTADEGHELVVHENSLNFIVNLSDYLDTGLFLDHRITRQNVKAEAKEKKVLNLFCYTGSFSVYAASGWAKKVVSVDLSKTYLDWAKRNMDLNGFIDEEKYSFVHADVTKYLKTLPENYFDIVIMDPPTFSNSKRMDGFLDIQRDHAELINDCLHCMKTGGILYFSTNSTKFILNKEGINSINISNVTKQTTPFDFDGRLSRFCFRIVKS